MHENKPHVALLASPGMGHVIPLLEFSKRLVVHQVDVTLFVVASGPSSAEYQLVKKEHSINTVVLPPVDISSLLDPTASIVTRIVVMMRESLPSLRSAITTMKVCPTALIVDLFGTEAIAIAHELGMLSYTFITSNAWFLAITVIFPNVNEQIIHDHLKKQEPLKIPGCKPVQYDDTLEIFQVKDVDDQFYKGFALVGIEIPTADGILVNTWQDLEPISLGALKKGANSGLFPDVPIYPIGPLIRLVEPGMKSDVLDWLDRQPKGSVIYVSFGSGGTHSAEQITELAWGLEKSQQMFIWVVRPPMENDASGSYFTVGNRSDGTPDYLPEGFVARNKEMGLVVPMWAPQREILSHESVGGFLSHCGWNSSLESIINGVPMIAWPLYAEQKMNAAMLSEEFGVAVRLRVSPEIGLVVREEIEKMVRKVMENGEEGNEMRKKVKELKKRGEKAIEIGGSSYNMLENMVKECEISGTGMKFKGA